MKERADLGFADVLEDFDPAEWAPKPAPKPAVRPERSGTRKAAAAAGFRSREPAAAPEPAERAGGAPLRRRRTGRNTLFNLKARAETIEAFCAVADRQGWGLGETLEQAVALLEREYKAT
jgi:hypothetical protein